MPTTMRRETVSPVVARAVEAVSSVEGGELLLVVNGPREGRRPLEVRSPRLRVLECSVERISVARNAGLREARNDAVIFTDDDCLITPEWLQTLTSRLYGGDHAVTAPLEVRRDGPVTAFLDYQRIYHARPLDAATAEYPLGAAIGVRRDVFGGLFDEGMHTGDDGEFGQRLRAAGIPVAYVSEAPTPVHLLPEELETVTNRFLRYGTSNGELFLNRDRAAFSVPKKLSIAGSVAEKAI